MSALLLFLLACDDDNVVAPEVTTDFSVRVVVEQAATTGFNEVNPGEVFLQVGDAVLSAIRICEPLGAEAQSLLAIYDDGGVTECAAPVDVTAWLVPFEGDDEPNCGVGLHRLLGSDLEAPKLAVQSSDTVFAWVDATEPCPQQTDLVELVLQ
jgi:hypothetical protein